MKAPMIQKTILAKAIRIDGGTQARTEINLDTVADYAAAIKEGAVFPAVVVFFDGTDYWLADGFHRYHATNEAGVASILADVHTGTQRDAILFSASANSLHGLRRTNSDKRKAVLMLLEDSEWGAWSDREIAKQCHVSHTFVAAVRLSLATVASEKPAERIRKDKHGNTGTIKTGNIGKTGGTVAEPTPPAAPAAPATTEPAAPIALTEAEQLLVDAYGDVDPVEEWEKAQARIVELEAILAAAEEDDQKAATVKWKRLYDIATRRQNELMDSVNQRERELKARSNVLRRIGIAMDEDDFTKLASLVEAMARATKVPA